MATRPVLLIAAALACGAGPVAGQDVLPDTAPILLPEHHERTLSNGLRVLVVPDSGAPVTTYTLLIPGGSAADPPGKEGTAAVLASLMEDVGAQDPAMQLGVTASADALALTLVDSTGLASASARRLGDAVGRVRLTDSAVVAARDARSTAVARALEDPEVLGERLLVDAVYGDHPYGRVESPATVRTIEAEDVAAWRGRFVRPDGAVLSVTGPLDPDGLAGTLEAGFGEWEADPGPPPEPAAEPLSDGVGGRRVLVHRPGMPRAVVQLGIDLPRATDPDWTALAVLDQVLSGARDAPLSSVRPPGGEESIVAGTATAAQRRRGPGVFRAQATVRTSVVADVVAGLLAGLAEAGETLPAPAHLRPAQERLAGSFRAQLSVPAGAAALMAVNRIIGLPDSLMSSYPVRVRRLGPQDVRDVAARHLDTARMSVVVVGDATLLRRDLEEVGLFELVDVRGMPLAPEDLEVLEEELELDASSLRPITLEYRVMVGGREEGTVTRSLEPGPDSLPSSMVFRAAAELGPQEMTQTVTFSVPDFRPLSAGASVSAGGRTAVMRLTVEGDRVFGTVTGGGRSAPVEARLPDRGLLGDMVELAAWLIPPGDGGAYRFPVLTPEEGRVDPVVLRVGGVEEVTVPAGTFHARRIEVVGEQPQTYWVRTEGLRVPVRIAPAGRPVTLELVSVR